MNGTSENFIHHLRLALTLAHLSLVSIGMINLLVIILIVIKPYMRSITNVYMVGLCSADFIYLINLTLVAAAQLNNRSWVFGSTVCTLYHGTESTGTVKLLGFFSPFSSNSIHHFWFIWLH